MAFLAFWLLTTLNNVNAPAQQYQLLNVQYCCDRTISLASATIDDISQSDTYMPPACIIHISDICSLWLQQQLGLFFFYTSSQLSKGLANFYFLCHIYIYICRYSFWYLAFNIYWTGRNGPSSSRARNCTYENPKLTERQPKEAADVAVVTTHQHFSRVARAFQLRKTLPQ